MWLRCSRGAYGARIVCPSRVQHRCRPVTPSAGRRSEIAEYSTVCRHLTGSVGSNPSGVTRRDGETNRPAWPSCRLGVRIQGPAPCPGSVPRLYAARPRHPRLARLRGVPPPLWHLHQPVRLAARLRRVRRARQLRRGAARSRGLARAAGDGDLRALRHAVQLSLGLFIAYLLFQKVRGRETFRILFFLPYITSTVASAAVWSYLYSPDNGLLQHGLKAVGLPPQRWLAEPAGVFALVAREFRRDVAGLGNRVRAWHCSRSRSTPPGSSSATTSRSSWPGSAIFQPSCTKRPKSTAPAAGRSFATSPCR